MSGQWAEEGIPPPKKTIKGSIQLCCCDCREGGGVVFMLLFF